MIDRMTYDMTFDLVTRTGLVVVNTSLVDPRHLAACEEQVCKVFACGYAMGNLLALLPPGETLGDLTVPKDKLGVCTVCSSERSSSRCESCGCLRQCRRA